MISIFDKEISKIAEIISGAPYREYAYDPQKALPVTEYGELVLARDCAFELGGSDTPSTGATVATDTLTVENKIIVVGKELNQINSDVNYARFVIIGLSRSPDDEQGIFDLVKSLEYAKYKENVGGFMVRSSAFTHREQVRVSKTAIKAGLSFEKLGDTAISGYLKRDAVKAVTVVYVADAGVDFDELYRVSGRTREIISAFNHILDNALVDCAHCSLKEICDEVDGIKEAHFRRNGSRN